MKVNFYLSNRLSHQVLLLESIVTEVFIVKDAFYANLVYPQMDG